jgi:hypothetical protein
MKTILDCPRCEEKDNCTMQCLGDVEPKTYLKSATADELSRNQVIPKSAAASALEALTSSEAVAPAPHSAEASK